MKSVYLVVQTHYYGTRDEKEVSVMPIVFSTKEQAQKSIKSLMNRYIKNCDYQKIAFTGNTSKLRKEVCDTVWTTYITLRKVDL